MDISLNTLFWICAVVGTAFFVLKTVTMFIGLGAEQFDLDVDDGLVEDVFDSASSVMAFKFLSITGITTFLMMFGWSGIIFSRDYDLPVLSVAVVAIIVGLLSVFLIAYLFQIAIKLISKGAEVKPENLIGKVAIVYSRIPEEGTGRIQINVGGMIREIDCTSKGSILIESQTKVRVVRVINVNLVEVEVLKD
ncbi:MAG: hypothetical protein KDC47_10170 [Flavobacteriaceae bacterium]|nr:hypothetical protein [Flavobacteriaceae bacterium]